MRPTLERRHAAGLACLLLAIGARSWMEAAMLRHMLVQLPLIVVAGCLLAARLQQAPMRDKLDPHGLTSLTALLLLSAYWMVPLALEESLRYALAELAKFISLLLAGTLLPGAVKRARTVIQLFFLGNFCWMMAIAGIQYQDSPQRLCNAYALDDQLVTGSCLVGVSIVLALTWCIWQGQALLFTPTSSTHYASTSTEH